MSTSTNPIPVPAAPEAKAGRDGGAHLPTGTADAADGLICTVVENPFTHPDAAGQDAYMASIAELPGLIAFGPTESEARRLWRQLALREMSTASQEQRKRLEAVRTTVQFNQRITVEQKAHMARRAAEAGVSVRRFMLNQCLNAPIWRPPTTMPPEQKEQHWRAVASVASDRKASDPTNLEGTT